MDYDLMDYDLGYFDLETRLSEPLENLFGPEVLPMSPELLPVQSGGLALPGHPIYWQFFSRPYSEP
jgi:hypothetical protein